VTDNQRKPTAKLTHIVSYKEALIVWMKIALLSFGGPASQIAIMHRILIEEKKWISETRFLHALNYCMLLPGPEAQQLVTYIGWLLHGVWGGILAGSIFILPGALSMMLFCILYVSYGHHYLFATLFFGMRCAVIAILFQSIFRLSLRALTDNSQRLTASISFIAIYFYHISFPIIILIAAIAGIMSKGFKGGYSLIMRRDEKPLAASHNRYLIDNVVADICKDKIHSSLYASASIVFLWLAPLFSIILFSENTNIYNQISRFFLKLALVSFGGAYAILAYVAQYSVEGLHWLGSGEMLDGLGMAESTPGPLLLVLQFVGFIAAYHHPGQINALTAGVLGGVLASWATFTPCFLWIFLGAPFVERLRVNERLSSALSFITAAVVGVMINLGFWFSIHTLFETVTIFDLYGLSFDMPIIASLNAPALFLSLIAALLVFWLRLSMFVSFAVCAVLAIGLRVIYGA